MVTSASGEVEADLAIEAHRSAVDARLREAIEAGAQTLGEVLDRSEGADPRLVAQRVHALALPVSGRVATTAPERADPWTPELHARDYEWYFAPSCAAELAARMAGAGDSVLCLGTPTVAFALLDVPHVRRVTLVDRNPLALQRYPGPHPAALEACCEDLAAARPSAGAYDAAVFDAPWYLPALRHWLAVAATAVRPGGRIVFALLQSLHRPSAAADRASILACADALGSVTVEPGGLRYASPRFEREAMRTAGIIVPERWRRADRVEIVVRGRSASERVSPPAPPVVSEPSWLRWVVGTQVIHLDPQAVEAPGDVLTSVDRRADFRYGSISTRDPRRPEIGLWTSRSRVAHVRRPALVAALLDRLASAGEHEALACAPQLRGMPAPERARVLDAMRVIVGPIAPGTAPERACLAPPMR